MTIAAMMILGIESSRALIVQGSRWSPLRERFGASNVQLWSALPVDTLSPASHRHMARLRHSSAALTVLAQLRPRSGAFSGFCVTFQPMSKISRSHSQTIWGTLYSEICSVVPGQVCPCDGMRHGNSTSTGRSCTWPPAYTSLPIPREPEERAADLVWKLTLCRQCRPYGQCG